MQTFVFSLMQIFNAVILKDTTQLLNVLLRQKRLAKLTNAICLLSQVEINAT